MQMKSLASQTDGCALGPESAEKGAHELQESFESAVRGEDGDDDKEGSSGGNSNENNSSDEDEDANGDDDSGIPAASAIAPGVSTQLHVSRSNSISDIPSDHQVLSAKAWVSVVSPGKSVRV